jgi:hypothetical protein
LCNALLCTNISSKHVLSDDHYMFGNTSVIHYYLIPEVRVTVALSRSVFNLEIAIFCSMIYFSRSRGLEFLW